MRRGTPRCGEIVGSASFGVGRRAHASGSLMSAEPDRRASSDGADAGPHGHYRSELWPHAVVVAQKGRRLRVSRGFQMAHARARRTSRASNSRSGEPWALSIGTSHAFRSCSSTGSASATAALARRQAFAVTLPAGRMSRNRALCSLRCSRLRASPGAAFPTRCGCVRSRAARSAAPVWPWLTHVRRCLAEIVGPETLRAARTGGARTRVYDSGTRRSSGRASRHLRRMDREGRPCAATWRACPNALLFGRRVSRRAGAFRTVPVLRWISIAGRASDRGAFPVAARLRIWPIPRRSAFRSSICRGPFGCSGLAISAMPIYGRWRPALCRPEGD